MSKVELEFKNVSVGYVDDPTAKKIMLPEGMPIDKAVEWLLREKEQQEKVVQLYYEFVGYYPVDAAMALYKAMQRTYGFAAMVDTPGFFGPSPPAFIGVEVSPGKTIQIPWGSMQIHGIEGRLDMQVGKKDGQFILTLGGKIKQRDRKKVDDLAAKTREVLQTESIYKGKAVRVNLEESFDPLQAPKFMDLGGVSEDDLVFGSTVQDMVDTNILTPIKHTEACRLHGIPRRRGVLLAGPYGTGKTLTARVAAKVAEDNRWTFVYVQELEHLEKALYFAKNYAPSVVFVEDINRLVSGERDEEMDSVFNVMDGIDRKSDEVMVIFTTNDIDEIHPGMMRPGRIDAIVPVDPPDAKAVERLVRKYGSTMVPVDTDLTGVGKILAGHIPAVVREAVERAKLRALRDGNGSISLTAEHLEAAAKQLVKHSEYINRPYEEDKPDLAILGEAIGKSIKEALVAAELVDFDEWDEDHVDKIRDEVSVGDVVSNALDEAGRPKRKRNGLRT